MSETTDYRAPVSAGLWKKITHYGILHVWFVIWMGLLGAQAIACLKWFGWRWFLLSLIPTLGEFFFLQWLTAFDINWDDIIHAQLTRRYKSYYDV